MMCKQVKRYIILRAHHNHAKLKEIATKHAIKNPNDSNLKHQTARLGVPARASHLHSLTKEMKILHLQGRGHIPPEPQLK
jgi:hypothetical protein